MCVYVCALSVVSDSLWFHVLYPARLLCLWNFLSKNIGTSFHFLSKASSQPRDWTHIFPSPALAGMFFTSWATNLYLKGCVCVCSVAKSCLTHCYPMNCSPPGSSVHEIFSQEYWSGLQFPTPEDLLEPGIETVSPCLLHWQVCALPLSHLRSPFKGI